MSPLPERRTPSRPLYATKREPAKKTTVKKTAKTTAKTPVKKTTKKAAGK